MREALFLFVRARRARRKAAKFSAAVHTSKTIAARNRALAVSSTVAMSCSTKRASRNSWNVTASAARKKLPAAQDLGFPRRAMPATGSAIAARPRTMLMSSGFNTQFFQLIGTTPFSCRMNFLKLFAASSPQELGPGHKGGAAQGPI